MLDRTPEPAAGVDELRPHAEDGRTAGRRGRRLSQGDRHPADSSGEVWWSLANLKTVKFDAERHRGDAAGAASQPV